MILRTARLRLVPVTVELARADLAGPARLAAALGAAVPASWPPEHMDAPAIQWALKFLDAGGPDAEWLYFYLVREDQGAAGPVVAGTAGYKGAPKDGMVEVGYSVVPEHRRQGIASEAVTALVERAFERPDVALVRAETLPVLIPSIGVLENHGFHLVGPGSETGVIRYELTRADHDAGRTWTPPHLRTLIRLADHMRWADHEVHSALATGVPDPRALQLYAHILAAEAVWLARLRGTEPPVPVWPTLTLDDARRLGDQVTEDLRAYLWQLEPEGLDRLIAYRTSRGDPHETRAEDILCQVLLHGAYHRGQVASLLRAAGRTPPSTDYISFVRGAPAARSDVPPAR
jgi:ribosomal-protein-alanine N-acetyltransferase